MEQKKSRTGQVQQTFSSRGKNKLVKSIRVIADKEIKNEARGILNSVKSIKIQEEPVSVDAENRQIYNFHLSMGLVEALRSKFEIKNMNFWLDNVLKYLLDTEDIKNIVYIPDAELKGKALDYLELIDLKVNKILKLQKELVNKKENK